MAPHQVDVPQQLSQTLQRVVLALDGDQHLGPGHHRVHREQAEGGRAVDEDVVQRLLVSLDGPLKPALPRHQRHELDLRTGEIDGGGGAEETFDVRDGLNHFGERAALHQDVIDRGDIGVVIDAQGRGGIALGSRSTTRTRAPCRASEAARLTVVVVLPTPPFWLATTMTRVRSGRGSPSPARPRASTASWAARPMGVSSIGGGVSRETPSPTDSVRGPGTGSVIGPAMLASDRNDSLSSTTGSQ